MTKKNDITRERLIILLAKYIKANSKKLKDGKNSINVNIEHNNWRSCSGSWSRSEILFDGDCYCFCDKEIGDEDFLKIVRNALKESKCNGFIKTREWTKCDGYYSTKHEEFAGLIILGKPCKEFVSLNRVLKKYTNKELKDTEVNTSSVCGKRTSWSADISSTDYLCYQPETCKAIMDFIRSKRTSKDTLFFEVKNELSHGDEQEYRIAMYEESEWYGHEYNYITLKVLTPGGKEKGKLSVHINSRC